MSPVRLNQFVCELVDAPEAAAPSCESKAISRAEGLFKELLLSAGEGLTTPVGRLWRISSFFIYLSFLVVGRSVK